MKKDLTELSLAELWELFPIALVAPRGEWQTNYIEMEARLRRLLQNCPVLRISHIGSTAVPGIWAKDIVDVLVELLPEHEQEGAAHNLTGQGRQESHDGTAAQETTLAAAAAALAADGFLVMSTAPTRISLNLGYTWEGYADKVYHVHLRYAGDNDELYFRDYLRDHPDVAHAYEQLKLDLWHTYEHDRDGYTAAKTAFIRKWTDVAREMYWGRYSSSLSVPGN